MAINIISELTGLSKEEIEKIIKYVQLKIYLKCVIITT